MKLTDEQIAEGLAYVGVAAAVIAVAMVIIMIWQIAIPLPGANVSLAIFFSSVVIIVVAAAVRQVFK